MTLRWFCWVAAALLFSSALWAQEPVPATGVPFPVPPYGRISPESIGAPAVPNDPLELVTGEAQAADDGAQRAGALSLLEKARNLSNVRAQPYDLNTIFTSIDPATGSSAEWAIEDISPGRDIYRWTADGPSFSGIFLTKDSLLSSNRPTNAIPLRLAEVRDAIFFQYTWIHEHASVRTASGTLNGAELQCVLIAHRVGKRTPTGARNWNEYEYCIDSNTGLLATYSPVPGIYYHDAYSDSIHFHDKIIPSEFTIAEAGRTVVEARTLSVTDPIGPSSAMFSGEGLTALGAGPSTQGPEIYAIGGLPSNFSTQAMNSPRGSQIVVVTGITGKGGQLAESEILASTAEELNQAALDSANKAAAAQCSCGPGTAPGAVRPSREVIYVIRFFTNAT
ncbi:MAG: hypothetical protein WBF35_11180 [Candidatus Acidiferrales bacterium]